MTLKRSMLTQTIEVVLRESTTISRIHSITVSRVQKMKKLMLTEEL